MGEVGPTSAPLLLAASINRSSPRIRKNPSTVGATGVAPVTGAETQRRGRVHPAHHQSYCEHYPTRRETGCQYGSSVTSDLSGKMPAPARLPPSTPTGFIEIRPEQAQCELLIGRQAAVTRGPVFILVQSACLVATPVVRAGMLPAALAIVALRSDRSRQRRSQTTGQCRTYYECSHHGPSSKYPEQSHSLTPNTRQRTGA